MSVTIYHNPRCTKSRNTLKLLEENGIEPKVILYLETPPTANQLKSIIGKLGIEAKQLIRFGEPIAKELKLSKRDERPTKEWLQLMADNPKLIERPVVINGAQAALGRPPENVLEII